jgi:hypothetical protein
MDARARKRPCAPPLDRSQAVPSRLRRNPRHGRSWFRPAWKPTPRGIDRGELARRLYAPGGPKHGLRERRDVVDKRAIVNGYLRGRAKRERSGRWATTVAEMVRGLLPEMARLDAKPWDPAHRCGGDEELRHHYATALALLLDDLAAVGLLRWGGQRDNNGLWWRLEIELLDPWARWPPDGRAKAGERAGHPRLGKGEETSESDAEGRGRAARDGSPAVPAGSISRNSEEPFGAPATPAPTASPRKRLPLHSSPTCAGASARATSASETRAAIAVGKVSTGDMGLAWEARVAAALERVRLIDTGELGQPRSPQRVLAEQRCLRVEELRASDVGAAPVAWRLEEAFELLRGRSACFRRREHMLRLERAVRRYERYRDQRPAGWPEAGVAAVVRAIDELRELEGTELVTLGGVVRRFDALTGGMRRAHKRAHEQGELRRARRRAECRRWRQALPASHRRPRRQASLRELHAAFTASLRGDQGEVLATLGVVRTPEQLRRELRDGYLLEHAHDGRYGGWRCEPAEFHLLGLYRGVTDFAPSCEQDSVHRLVRGAPNRLLWEPSFPRSRP